MILRYSKTLIVRICCNPKILLSENIESDDKAVDISDRSRA